MDEDTLVIRAVFEADQLAEAIREGIEDPVIQADDKVKDLSKSLDALTAPIDASGIEKIVEAADMGGAKIQDMTGFLSEYLTQEQAVAAEAAKVNDELERRKEILSDPKNAALLGRIQDAREEVSPRGLQGKALEESLSQQSDDRIAEGMAPVIAQLSAMAAATQQLPDRFAQAMGKKIQESLATGDPNVINQTLQDVQAASIKEFSDREQNEQPGGPDDGGIGGSAGLIAALLRGGPGAIPGIATDFISERITDRISRPGGGRGPGGPGGGPGRGPVPPIPLAGAGGLLGGAGAALAPLAVGAAVTALIAGLGKAAAEAREFKKLWEDTASSISSSTEGVNELQSAIRMGSANTGLDRADLAGATSSLFDQTFSAESVPGALEPLSNLALVTNDTTSNVASYVGGTLTALGQDQTAENVDDLTNRLFELREVFSQAPAEIAGVAQAIAGAGEQAGLSSNQILDLAGAVTGLVSDSQAGASAVSAIFESLQRGYETGSESFFARVNIEPSGDIEQDFQAILEQFQGDLDQADFDDLNANFGLSADQAQAFGELAQDPATVGAAFTGTSTGISDLAMQADSAIDEVDRLGQAIQEFFTALGQGLGLDSLISGLADFATGFVNLGTAIIEGLEPINLLDDAADDFAVLGDAFEEGTAYVRDWVSSINDALDEAQSAIAGFMEDSAVGDFLDRWFGDDTVGGDLAGAIGNALKASMGPLGALSATADAAQAGMDAADEASLGYRELDAPLMATGLTQMAIDGKDQSVLDAAGLGDQSSASQQQAVELRARELEIVQQITRQLEAQRATQTGSFSEQRAFFDQMRQRATGPEDNDFTESLAGMQGVEAEMAGQISRYAQLEEQRQDILENSLRAQEQAYKGFYRQIEDLEKGFQRRLEDLQLSFDRRRGDMLEDYYERLEDLQEDYIEAQEDLEEQFADAFDDLMESRDDAIEDALESQQDQLEELAIQFERAVEQLGESIERIFDPFSRIAPQAIISVQQLLLNLSDQNNEIQKTIDLVDELRSRGLSEEAIDQLNLEDPENFRQLQAIASASDEEIADINREIEIRVDVSADLAEGSTSELEEDFDERADDIQRRTEKVLEDINEDFDEAYADLLEDQAEAAADLAENYTETIEDLIRDYGRAVEDLERDFNRAMEDMNRDFDRSMQDLNESLAESLADIAENTADQLQDLSEEMAKIGKSSGEEFAEAIELAMQSGLDNVAQLAMDYADVVSGIFDFVTGGFADINAAQSSYNPTPTPQTPTGGGVQFQSGPFPTVDEVAASISPASTTATPAPSGRGGTQFNSVTRSGFMMPEAEDDADPLAEAAADFQTATSGAAEAMAAEIRDELESQLSAFFSEFTIETSNITSTNVNITANEVVIGETGGESSDGPQTMPTPDAEEDGDQPTASAEGQYIVQAGDTLGEIAAMLGTTVEALLELNEEITNPDLIQVGQVLDVPGGDTSEGSAADEPHSRPEDEAPAPNPYTRPEDDAYEASTPGFDPVREVERYIRDQERRNPRFAPEQGYPSPSEATFSSAQFGGMTRSGFSNEPVIQPTDVTEEMMAEFEPVEPVEEPVIEMDMPVELIEHEQTLIDAMDDLKQTMEEVASALDGFTVTVNVQGGSGSGAAAGSGGGASALIDGDGNLNPGAALGLGDSPNGAPPMMGFGPGNSNVGIPVILSEEEIDAQNEAWEAQRVLSDKGVMDAPKGQAAFDSYPSFWAAGSGMPAGMPKPIPRTGDVYQDALNAEWYRQAHDWWLHRGAQAPTANAPRPVSAQAQAAIDANLGAPITGPQTLDEAISGLSGGARTDAIEQYVMETLYPATTSSPSGGTALNSPGATQEAIDEVAAALGLPGGMSLEAILEAVFGEDKDGLRPTDPDPGTNAFSSRSIMGLSSPSFEMEPAVSYSRPEEPMSRDSMASMYEPAQPQRQEIDMERLVASLERSMSGSGINYGDVYVQPVNVREFEAEMIERNRRKAIGRRGVMSNG